MTAKWRSDGFEMDDVLESTNCPCRIFYSMSSIGKKETRADKIRTIVAQMEYSYQIRKWTDSGVPFTTHL